MLQLLKKQKGKHMKKERREVVLPQNGKNKEENKRILEEVYSEIEKSRKRMSKFLGIAPYPVVGVVMFIYLFYSFSHYGMKELPINILMMILYGIGQYNSLKIDKTNVRTCTDYQLKKVVAGFNAEKNARKAETGKETIKIDYEKFKRLRKIVK